MTATASSPIPLAPDGRLRHLESRRDAYDMSRALEVGYRHIDTAQKMCGESGPGSVPRSEKRLASNATDLPHHQVGSNSNHASERAAHHRAIARDLRRLRRPPPHYAALPTLYGGIALPWPALEDAFAAGNARHPR